MNKTASPKSTQERSPGIRGQLEARSSRGQTRLQSLVEVNVSIAIGFCLSFILQIVLTQVYHKPFSIAENLQWTLWFTVLAIIRGYFLRRFFNWLHQR